MILVGDVCERLRELPEASVHCVVTSPPYWGLRDYGAEGQLGLEPTMAEYVDKMVAVFREVKRVLRDDGTCWVNLGDSYNANQGAGFNGQKRQDHANRHTVMKRPDGLKPKDLCGIPWRVAFALQADGWYLRSDIIWAKPNPMPESVTDRPTKAHEYLFLLTKRPKYYYDADAIREAAEYGRVEHPDEAIWQHRTSRGGRVNYSIANPSAGRNRRTVWNIPTQPYPEAHFATYPEALVKPCILAGCPGKVCAVCGAPWVREVETATLNMSNAAKAGTVIEGKGHVSSQVREGHDIRNGPTRQVTTTGWHPTCTHDADTEPGTVLDPFLGSGTTLKVAADEGRKGIGVELNPEYAALARKRIPARQEMLL